MARFITTIVTILILTAALRAQGAEVKKDLVFRKVGGRDLKLDLHLPSTKGPHPVALVIHGGGWRRGGRRSINAMALARLLNRDGIAGASIDYRHAPRFTHPAQIEDCRRAVQYLRANAKRLGLDGERVMACGASAGGHLAALLGAQQDFSDPKSEDPVSRESTRPDLVLSFFGPMDLSADEEATNSWGIRMVQDFLGVKDRSERSVKIARGASPVYQLQPGAPPFLFVHGTKDRLVPLSQSYRMAKVLDRAKVLNMVLEVPGGGHGDFTFRLAGSKPGKEPGYWRKARAFLEKHWLD